MNKAIKVGGLFNKEIWASYHNLRRMLDEYEKSL